MKEFWVINISNKNVSLRDLGIVLRAKCSYNLLNYPTLTLDQIINSVDSGSLYKKRDKIMFREPPNKNKFQEKNIEICQLPIIIRNKSSIFADQSSDDVLLEFDQDQAISDQKFAEQFSD